MIFKSCQEIIMREVFLNILSQKGPYIFTRMSGGLFRIKRKILIHDQIFWENTFTTVCIPAVFIKFQCIAIKVVLLKIFFFFLFEWILSISWNGAVTGSLLKNCIAKKNLFFKK